MHMHYFYLFSFLHRGWVHIHSIISNVSKNFLGIPFLAETLRLEALETQGDIIIIFKELSSFSDMCGYHGKGLFTNVIT